MNQEDLDAIRELFQPLINQHKELLKSIIITGSAVRKERVEGSDIDILVILDDHIEDFEEKDKKKAQRIIKEIQDSAKERGYNLHIQPPKTVSVWYSLLLSGKPWAITSMIYSQPIYDPDGFQETTQEMIKKTKPKSTRERAEELRKQVEEHIEKSEEKLEKGFQDVFRNVNKSAKLLIKYEEGRVFKINGTDHNPEDLIGDKLDIDRYVELRTDINNLNSEDKQISFQKLEETSEIAVDLIKQLQESFESELEEFHRELVKQTLEEIKESCKVLLEEKDADYSEENLFRRFKEEIIEEGILSEEYWSLIKNSKELREEPENIDEESIYHTVSGLREFETAANSLIERDLFQSFELHTDTDNARLTPMNEFEEKLLSRYRGHIKALYAVSKENLFETDSATVVLITDSKTEEIRETAKKLEVEIGEEHGFNIHTELEEINKYWERLQDGEEELIYEIKSCLVGYDPKGLLESTKKLVNQGELPNTIPGIKKSMKKQTLKSVIPVKKIKQDCLKEYYNAAIKLGQAKLLEEDIKPPVQKKVAKRMKEELLKDGNTTKEEIEMIQETIELFKNREYGKKDEISSEKIDIIRRKLKNTSK